jgi:hypothetical protein
MSSKPVVLVHSDSWEPFLFIVKTMASAGKRDVWKFIDPTLNMEPTLPTLADPPTATTIAAEKTTLVELTAEERDTYKVLYQTWKDDNARISSQLEALGKIQDHIINNISVDNIKIIQDKSTIYQMLVALKKHLAPTDRAKEYEITKRYAKLKSYNKSQPVEHWLDDWERTYSEGYIMGIPEVSGTRSLFDFAMAISSIDQSYGCTMEFDINRGIKHHEIPQLTDLVEDYRNHWRRNQTSTSTTGAVQFKGDDRPTKEKLPCQCGKDHVARKCLYWNPSIRPEGWTGDAEIFDKINQRLKKMRNQQFKQLVLESWKYDGITKGLKDDKKDQSKPVDLKGKDESTNRRNLGAYVASTHLTALGATDSVNRGPRSLYNSWALDSRTNIHICNDRNRSNYTMTYIATALDVIDSGKQTYLIESFSTITINIDTTTRLAYFQLRNVALAPKFISNLVFINILAKQNIY